jgi:hypothetical protein
LITFALHDDDDDDDDVCVGVCMWMCGDDDAESDVLL